MSTVCMVLMCLVKKGTGLRKSVVDHIGRNMDKKL